MEIVKDVDYTPHYLRSKQLIRELYETLNDRDISKSKEISLHLLTEIRLLHNAINILPS
jgi:hypothetical protein